MAIAATTTLAPAALRLADYFVGLVADLRRHPGDDLTSALIQAEVNGVRHTDTQIVAFLFLVISAGNESTGTTIGNAWYPGWLHPEVQRAGLNGRAGDWALVVASGVIVGGGVSSPALQPSSAPPRSSVRAS